VEFRFCQTGQNDGEAVGQGKGGQYFQMIKDPVETTQDKFPVNTRAACMHACTDNNGSMYNTASHSSRWDPSSQLNNRQPTYLPTYVQIHLVKTQYPPLLRGHTHQCLHYLSPPSLCFLGRDSRYHPQYTQVPCHSTTQLSTLQAFSPKHASPKWLRPNDRVNPPDQMFQAPPKLRRFFSFLGSRGRREFPQVAIRTHQ